MERNGSSLVFTFLAVSFSRLAQLPAILFAFELDACCKSAWPKNSGDDAIDETAQKPTDTLRDTRRTFINSIVDRWAMLSETLSSI